MEPVLKKNANYNVRTSVVVLLLNKYVRHALGMEYEIIVTNQSVWQLHRWSAIRIHISSKSGQATCLVTATVPCIPSPSNFFYLSHHIVWLVLNCYAQ